MSSYKYYVEPETIIRQLEARIAELEADCTRSHPHENMNKACEIRYELAKARNRLSHVEARNAHLLKVNEQDSAQVERLHEQINTLDAKVDQALEWQGQAMVRAERAEDLQEKAEMELRSSDPNYTPLLDSYADSCQRLDDENARLIAASIALRDDMIMRGKMKAGFDGKDDWTVEAGHTVWRDFCAALNTEQGDDC